MQQDYIFYSLTDYYIYNELEDEYYEIDCYFSIDFDEPISGSGQGYYFMGDVEYYDPYLGSIVTCYIRTDSIPFYSNEQLYDDVEDLRRDIDRQLSKLGKSGPLDRFLDFIDPFYLYKESKVDLNRGEKVIQGSL